MSLPREFKKTSTAEERLFIEAWNSDNEFNKINLYLRAARSGHAAAQNNLASLHYNLAIRNFVEGKYGWSESHLRKAMVWFNKSAAQGHVDAYFNLGIVYKERIGFNLSSSWETDLSAMEWFKMAALYGDKGALNELYAITYAYLQRVFQEYSSTEPRFVAIKHAFDSLRKLFIVLEKSLSIFFNKDQTFLPEFNQFLQILRDAYYLNANMLLSTALEERANPLIWALDTIRRNDALQIIPLVNYANFIWAQDLMALGRYSEALVKLKNATFPEGLPRQLVQNLAKTCQRKIKEHEGVALAKVVSATPWFNNFAKKLSFLGEIQRRGTEEKTPLTETVAPAKHVGPNAR